MSIAVELRDLAGRIEEYGPVAFVVTVGERGPHVVSTQVSVEGSALVTGAGRTTSANAGARPRVTLMWPPVAAKPDYCLLVDGDATVVEGAGEAGEATLRVAPDRAVLHRMADAGSDGPSCITVLDTR